MTAYIYWRLGQILIFWFGLHPREQEIMILTNVNCYVLMVLTDLFPDGAVSVSQQC